MILVNLKKKVSGERSSRHNKNWISWGTKGKKRENFRANRKEKGSKQTMKQIGIL